MFWWPFCAKDLMYMNTLYIHTKRMHSLMSLLWNIYLLDYGLCWWCSVFETELELKERISDFLSISPYYEDILVCISFPLIDLSMVHTLVTIFVELYWWNYNFALYSLEQICWSMANLNFKLSLGHPPWVSIVKSYSSSFLNCWQGFFILCGSQLCISLFDAKLLSLGL